MDKLECPGMSAGKMDACNPGIEHLLEECTESIAAFVIDPVLFKKTAIISTLLYLVTEIYIFTKPHIGETSDLVENLFLYTHIESAWIEFVCTLFVPPDATRSEDGGHGVIYGLLQWGK